MYLNLILNIFLVVFIINLKFCLPSSPCDFEEDIVSNIGPEECKNLGLFYVKNTGKNPNECLPGCVKRQGRDIPCVESIPNKKCAPGLKCNSTCIIDETSCMKYEYKTNSSTIAWKPICLNDGTYAPKQCKGESENGRCFCFDAYGKRIFGQEWSEKAKDMTCACSRYRSELERQGRTDVTLHCDSKGNYEPLQCDSGLCWCAESKTGKVLAAVVPDTMMTFLPCYNKTEIGEQYLRMCESQAFGQAKILQELITHGTQTATLPFILCDWDGSYGKFRIDGDTLYCTLRDNSKAGSWATQVTANMDDTVDCNCAKDTILYQDLGLKLPFNCLGNGNYEPVQKFATGEYFCVDSDGFAISDPGKEPLQPDDCKKFYVI